MMINFKSDYLEGACPEILNKMVETNFEQTSGYGEDYHSENAKLLIKKACKNDNVDVHFLVGGTQTNTTVIASVLRPFEGVICADTGHINCHETGAIESTGHKVMAITGKNGKITARQIEELFISCSTDPCYEHIVQPKMVYISNSTETGNLYKKSEIEEISAVCKKHGLVLFLDGARLGYALASEENDIELSDYARLCDIFYIGGTKCGALFGEAVVIVNDEYKKNFRSYIKQRGAMLAKGRLLGIQFEVLFDGNRYIDLCKNAITLANMVRDGFLDKGYEFLFPSPTNQQFPIIPDDKLSKLEKKYQFEFWQKVDENRTAVRVCTSWATKKENVEMLLADI